MLAAKYSVTCNDCHVFALFLDEDEDCIPTNLSSCLDTAVPVHLLTESNDNPPAHAVKRTKLSPTITSVDIEEKCSSCSPSFSAISYPSSGKEGGDEVTALEQDEQMCCADTQVRHRRALQLQSRKKLSRTKYRDVSKEEVSSVVESITSVSHISQTKHVLPCYHKSHSTSPSPSMLDAPRSSWDQKDSFHNPPTKRCPSEKQRISNIPESDSQLSMNISQRIPDSVQLPAVLLSHNIHQGKRKHSATLADHVHHSCPGIKQSSCHTVKAFEGTHNSFARRNVAVVLPKTPGIKAASTAVPADKSYFNGVAEYQHDRLCCNDKTLLFGPETTPSITHHPNPVFCTLSEPTHNDDMKLESHSLGDDSESIELVAILFPFSEVKDMREGHIHVLLFARLAHTNIHI